MLVAAAVCPHPPVIVPEVAAGAAPELVALRAACDEAMKHILGTRPELLIAVGPGPDGSGVREYGPDACGSFAPYGVDVVIGTDASGAIHLPLSLSVGAWLMQRNGWNGQRSHVAVGGDLDPDTCQVVGERLASSADRVALLVLGDGSARRSEKSPGYVDARAAAYDADIRRALEHGDLQALRNLDPELADDLLVGGRSSWQVLTGAARDLDVEAKLLADEAPYGVGYFVATWTPR